MTALLSNALTPVDVARVVVDEVGDAVDATTVVVASVVDGEIAGILMSSGDADNEDETSVRELLDARLDGDSSGARAVRSRRSILLGADGGHPELFVPLVAGRRTNGLLVVEWEQERRLLPDERALVEALAGQAAQALDRASHFASEQAIAETLQRSVLPVSLPRVDGVELAARYLPGSAQLDVGGDWFDALRLPDGRLGLVVGDVVGKGVQAAASMAQLRNAIRAFSVERLKPSSVLARLNRLAEDALDTSFATLAYIVLDPETSVCRLSCAGHPPPVIAYPDGRVELLDAARGLPLGTGIDAKYRQETHRAAGRHGARPLHGRARRAPRPVDRRRPRRPPRRRGERPEESGSAPRPHPRASRRRRRARRRHRTPRGSRPSGGTPRAATLRVPSHVDSMDLVRDAMRAWLGGVRLERSQAEDVVLATWEACANAIEHAVDPTHDHITVHAEVEDSLVRVVVEDTGSWGSPSVREDRGLGLRLISSLVSSVDISQGDTGTRITVEKALAEPTGLEQPDQQHDDDDEREDSTTDVHRALLSRLTSAGYSTRRRARKPRCVCVHVPPGYVSVSATKEETPCRHVV